MKLLFVINVDWFLYSHRLPVILEAKRRGYDVHIATSITNISKKQSLLKRGIEIHELNFDRNGKSIWRLIKIFLKLITLISEVKPDILHLVTIQPVLLGGIAARICRVKNVVYSISGLGHAFLQKNLLTSIRRHLILKIYHISLSIKKRIIIFQNYSDLSLLSKSCSLCPSEVILLPGSGVNLKKYKFKELSDNIPIILMASRLLVSKGVYDFIDAAKIIKKRGLKIRFQLAGKPDEFNPLSISKSQIKKWVSEENIEYLGFCDNLHQIIPRSHIVVLPSYYPEGLPKILCEAAACGRAVITTNKPGCKDAIENGKTGILIKEKSPHELADAIIQLIEDNKLLKRMSIAARNRSEKLYDINNIVEEHIKVYDYLAK